MLCYKSSLKTPSVVLIIITRKSIINTFPADKFTTIHDNTLTTDKHAILYARKEAEHDIIIRSRDRCVCLDYIEKCVTPPRVFMHM